MSKILFTSDTHFGHKRILEVGTGRPWDTIEEHDNALIERWNSVVGAGDRVYFLGDFSFYKTEQTLKILSQLQGTIHWIRGNHDPKDNPNPSKVASFRDLFDLKVPYTDENGEKQKQLIVLCHYPLLTWNRGHYGAWMLHGHSHGNLFDDGNTRLDVGVDVWDYTPVSYEQIKDKMQGRTFKAVDHHV